MPGCLGIYARRCADLTRGDRLTQALNKAFQWKMEKLNAGYEHFKGAYQPAQTLPSARQCAENIGALNISEDEAMKTIKELVIPPLFKLYKG